MSFNFCVIKRSRRFFPFAASVIGVLLLSVFYLLDSRSVVAFIGPSQPPPGGSGAIRVDSFFNLSVGTSTTASTTKLLTVASTTASSSYAFQAVQPGGAPILVVRGDGRVGVATNNPSQTFEVAGNANITGAITASSFVGGSLSAANVTPGVFNSTFSSSGNYAFPSSLAVGTTSPSYAYRLEINGGLRLYPTNTAPTGANGVIYYDSLTNKFRCYQNGAWIDCASGGGTLTGSGTSGQLAVWTTTTSLGTGGGNIAGNLTVIGNTNITGNLTASGNFTAGGNLIVSGNEDLAGTLTVGGGTGKINAGTIDPIYTIAGTRYATYLPAMTGVKEETTGVVVLGKFDVSNSNIEGGASTSDVQILQYVIDFRNLETGSDLWLFSKVTNLKENFDKMVVLLTPSFAGRVWYKKDSSRHTLTFFALPSTIPEISAEISYRLSAPRFDWQAWPNLVIGEDGTAGFVLPE